MIKIITRIMISSEIPIVPNILVPRQPKGSRKWVNLAATARRCQESVGTMSHKVESKQRHDFGLERLAVNKCFPLGHIHIQLAPNAEFAGKIDAGLDRKTCARDQPAAILGF